MVLFSYYYFWGLFFFTNVFRHYYYMHLTLQPAEHSWSGHLDWLLFLGLSEAADKNQVFIISLKYLKKFSSEKLVK
jgi:hypothetical protein